MHARRLQGIVNNTPPDNHRRALAKVDRRSGSIWTQLKTGHIGLNVHLKRIGISDTAICHSCGQYNETIDHFLRHCRAYTEQRKELRQKVKGDMADIRKLLGNNTNLTYVVKYVRGTGRLAWFKEQGPPLPASEGRAGTEGSSSRGQAVNSGTRSSRPRRGGAGRAGRQGVQERQGVEQQTTLWAYGFERRDGTGREERVGMDSAGGVVVGREGEPLTRRETDGQ